MNISMTVGMILIHNVYNHSLILDIHDNSRLVRGETPIFHRLLTDCYVFNTIIYCKKSWIKHKFSKKQMQQTLTKSNDGFIQIYIHQLYCQKLFQFFL